VIAAFRPTKKRMEEKIEEKHKLLDGIVIAA